MSIDNRIEGVKLGVSLLSGVFLRFFGGTAKEITVLLILIATDTAFGWVKAVKLGNWKSRDARLGFMGKIVELILLGCLYALDWVFETDILKYTGIYYFGICELSSILENYSQINGNLPDGIAELLKSFRESIASRLVKKIKEFMDKIMKE
jgi:toxin secretion/phage lysis holin